MTTSSLVPTLRFPRLRADWHADVGIDAADWPGAPVLVSVPLPGPGAPSLEVRLHRDGTWWTLPGSDEPVVVPWTAQSYEWESGGELRRTRLQPYLMKPVEELRRATRALGNPPAGRQDRVLACALALTQEMARGIVRDWIQRAARVFERALDDEQAKNWVACALELRLGLEELSMHVDAPMLVEALAHADEALASFDSAVLLVDDDVYAGLTRDMPPDEETWWGKRASFERRLPVRQVRQRLVAGRSAGAEVVTLRPRPIWRAAAADQDVSTMLRGLRGCPPGEVRHRFDQVHDALDATPCPWLRADLTHVVEGLRPARDSLGWRWRALREFVAPVPGRVPVLLYLPERHEGVLLELRVAHDRGGLWSRAPALQPIAREAIRCAHAAVAALSDTRQPRFDLEAHTVDLVGPQHVLDSLRAVDGTSLALPAAIAFASLWLGIAPRPDVAATGGLTPGRQDAQVETVGTSGLEAKRRALSAWVRPATARLLAAPAEPRPVPLPGIEMVAVRRLSEALAAAGLQLRGVSPWAPLGDQATRLAELERMFHELRTQDLARHRLHDENPWSVLADRIDLITASLTGTVPEEDPRLQQAHAYAALAHAHAGDLGGLGRLPDPGDESSLPPNLAALHALSGLVQSIGTRQSDACERLRGALDGKLDRLHESERRTLLGVARGTQGRSWLHDTGTPLEQRVAKALPLLEQAVDHHVRFVPVEAPRSRIYLAMAMRMAGWSARASAQLDHAAAELEAHTLHWSVPYYRATKTYWHYERARLAVASQCTDDALEHTRAALELADDRGFWPIVGILRTRAWAHRQRHEDREADTCVERMRTLAGQAPAGSRALVERIIEEASGPPRSDGEVY